MLQNVYNRNLKTCLCFLRHVTIIGMVYIYKIFKSHKMVSLCLTFGNLGSFC